MRVGRNDKRARRIALVSRLPARAGAPVFYTTTARYTAIIGGGSDGADDGGDDDDDDDGGYRDRAAERRKVFGVVPLLPAYGEGGGALGGGATVSMPSGAGGGGGGCWIPSAAQTLATAATTPMDMRPSTSVGAAMLAKLGWRPGQGIGKILDGTKF